MQVAELFASLSLDPGPFEEALSGVRESLVSLGGELEAAGAGLTRSLSAPLQGLGREALEAGMAFSARMSRVEAISGACGEELGSLRQAALQMGSTTAFTAAEAAQALQYMAMAGWGTGEMLGGLAPVMNLAAASGEDLARTSDIVTDAMTAMGYSAAKNWREAGNGQAAVSNARHFADVLSATAASANTDVAGMGETFRYAGTLAGTLGYSVEDVALAVGLMANTGTKASQAGTSLRSVLRRMSSGTAECRRAMDSYGISMTDAGGRMRSLREVMEQMREVSRGMGEQERLAFANAVAGTTGMQGLLGILNATREDWDRLSAAIDNCDGATERMAGTALGNARGALTLLKSAVEGLQISLFDLAEGGLRGALTGLTGFVDGVRQAPESLLRGGLATGAVLAAAGPALMAGGKLLSLLPLLASPAGLAGAGVAALTLSLADLTASAGSGMTDLGRLSEGMSMTGQAALRMAKALRAALPGAEEEALSLLSLSGTHLSRLLSDVTGAAEAAGAEVTGAVVRILSGAVSEGAARLPELFSLGGSLASSLALGLLSGLPEAAAAGARLLSGVLEALSPRRIAAGLGSFAGLASRLLQKEDFRARAREAAGAVREVLTRAVEDLQEALQLVLEIDPEAGLRKLSGALPKVLELAGTLGGEFLRAGREAGEQLRLGLAGQLETGRLREMLSSAAAALREGLGTALAELREGAGSLGEILSARLEEAVSALPAAGERLREALTLALSFGQGALLSFDMEGFSAAGARAAEMLSAALSAGLEAGTAAAGLALSLLSGFARQVPVLAQGLGQAVGAALSRAEASAGDAGAFMEKVAAALGRVRLELGGLAAGILSALSEAVGKESPGALIRAVGELLTGAVKAAGTLASGSLAGALNLAEGITGALSALDLAPVRAAAGEAVSGIARTLEEQAGSLLAAAGELLDALTRGLTDALPERLAELTRVGLEAAEAVLSGISSLAVRPEAEAFMASLGEALRAAVSALGNVCGEIVRWLFEGGGAEALLEAGERMAGLLLRGLGNAAAGLARGVDSLLRSVLDAALSRFGVDLSDEALSLGEVEFRAKSGGEVLRGSQLYALLRETDPMSEVAVDSGGTLSRVGATLVAQMNAYTALMEAGARDSVARYAGRFEQAGVAAAQYILEGAGQGLGDPGSAALMAALLEGNLASGLGSARPELMALFSGELGDSLQVALREACLRAGDSAAAIGEVFASRGMEISAATARALAGILEEGFSQAGLDRLLISLGADSAELYARALEGGFSSLAPELSGLGEQLEREFLSGTRQSLAEAAPQMEAAGREALLALARGGLSAGEEMALALEASFAGMGDALRALRPELAEAAGEAFAQVPQAADRELAGRLREVMTFAGEEALLSLAAAMNAAGVGLEDLMGALGREAGSALTQGMSASVPRAAEAGEALMAAAAQAAGEGARALETSVGEGILSGAEKAAGRVREGLETAFLSGTGQVSLEGARQNLEGAAGALAAGAAAALSSASERVQEAMGSLLSLSAPETGDLEARMALSGEAAGGALARGLASSREEVAASLTGLFAGEGEGGWEVTFRERGTLAAGALSEGMQQGLEACSALLEAWGERLKLWLEETGQGLLTGLAALGEQAAGALAGTLQAGEASLEGAGAAATALGQETAGTLSALAEQLETDLTARAQGTAAGIVQAAHPLPAELQGLGDAAMTGLTQALSLGGAQACAAAAGAAREILRMSEAVLSRASGYAVGQQLMQGISGGIASLAGEVARQAAAAVRGALSAMKSAAGIRSPSRETYAIGQRMDEGAALGISGGLLAGSAARQMDLCLEEMDREVRLPPVTGRPDQNADTATALRQLALDLSRELSALAGGDVYLDGTLVGQLVAPEVGRRLGRETRTRYSGTRGL